MLLKIKNLSISKNEECLISGSNFNVNRGEVVGLFGNSGSGKSVFSFFLMGFLDQSVFSFSADSAVFTGQDRSFSLLSKNKNDWISFRKRCVSMIFQDPTTALNPALICGEQIKEACFGVKKENRLKYCFKILESVGIGCPEKTYFSFPHQLSGGQKQRVVIAIAIASKPALLVADEPTTSLDPSVQRSVLDLVLSLKNLNGASVVLISHNLDLIRYYCDRVYLLKKNKFVDILNMSVKTYVDGLDLVLKKIKTKSTTKISAPSLSVFYKKNDAVDKKKCLCLFDIKNLSVCFFKNKSVFYALSGVSFKVFWGDCLGLVGCSGSGKTTIGRVLCGLQKKYSGSFVFPKKGSFLKNSVQMVYQDPFSSFNPKYTVGNSVSEIIKLYNSNYTVSDLFKIVSLEEHFINRFPHELSGGQKQRVSIARVLASNPDVIVFDESLSALDIKTQYSILELIRFINCFLNITVVFISHDINSVYYLCKNIIVLSGGKVVDFFKSSDLFLKKRKPYTKKLIIDSNFL